MLIGLALGKLYILICMLYYCTILLHIRACIPSCVHTYTGIYTHILTHIYTCIHYIIYTNICIYRMITCDNVCVYICTIILYMHTYMYRIWDFVSYQPTLWGIVLLLCVFPHTYAITGM